MFIEPILRCVGSERAEFSKSIEVNLFGWNEALIIKLYIKLLPKTSDDTVLYDIASWLSWKILPFNTIMTGKNETH